MNQTKKTKRDVALVKASFHLNCSITFRERVDMGDNERGKTCCKNLEDQRRQN